MAQSGASLDVSHLLALSKSMREGTKVKKAPISPVISRRRTHKANKIALRGTAKSHAHALVHAVHSHQTLAMHTAKPELHLKSAPASVARVRVRNVSEEPQASTPQEIQRAETTTPTAPTGAAMSASVGTVNYDVQMLTEDRTLTMPSNTWFYYFKVMPGVKMANDGTMSVVFQTSKTLLPREGSMTVILNGTPVSSRYLDGTVETTTWNVPMPVKYMKTGYNEIRVVTRQRTSEGPCRDIDDAGNWVRLSTATKLHLSRKEMESFPLYSYPFPYLDPIANDAVNGAWTVSPNASASELGAMFGIASDWGKREPLKGLPIHVNTGDSGYSLGVLANNGAAGSGSLQVSGTKLGVSGGDATGLDFARLALANPELVAQMEGASATINSKPEVASEEQTSKMGTFSLRELGYPSMTLAGIYHQRTTLTVKRPIRADLGKESLIRFKFRHSASLYPRRSVLSISLNNLPIGSARLDQSNVAGGVLIAKIPVSELAKNSWTFEIACYHDLELVDCSKVYDDIAWTVIEGTSEFVLTPGKLAGKPYLENFPYMATQDGHVTNPGTMRLSASPSSTELSVAAMIAARAGQSNRFPMAWNVKKGTDSGGSDAGSSVLVGYFSEAERFSALKNELLVWPSGGKFEMKPSVHLLPSAMEGGVIVQAVPSPYKAGSVLYVVMAQDDEALKRFGNVISDPKRIDELAGEAVLLTKQGRVVSLIQRNPAELEKELNTERDRYTQPMKFSAAFLGLMVLGVLFWIVAQFRRPKSLS